MGGECFLPPVRLCLMTEAGEGFGKVFQVRFARRIARRIWFLPFLWRLGMTHLTFSKPGASNLFFVTPNFFANGGGQTCHG